MTATQFADYFFPDHLSAQFIRPGTGSIDDEPGGDFYLLLADKIVNLQGAYQTFVIL